MHFFFTAVVTVAHAVTVDLIINTHTDIVGPLVEGSPASICLLCVCSFGHVVTLKWMT